MTGIERLRELSKGMHNHRVTVWQLTDDAYEERFGVTKHGPTIKNFLSDIADQIERESDVETVRSDAMEAWEWVREHGGLDHVKAEWSSRVPYDLYERRRRRLLDHIAECETALGRRNVRIEELGRTIEFFQLNNYNFRHLLADVAERLGFTRYGDDYEPEDLLDALDRRLMPEGCEWPRYEDGEPVPIGGEFMGKDGKTYTAKQIQFIGKCFSLFDFCDRKPQFSGFYGERVKRPSVPAGDGEPLEVGQTVWDVDGYGPLVVKAVPSKGEQLVVLDNGGTNFYRYPEKLTHERPDSWERIEEDIADLPCSDYCDIYRIDASDTSYEHAMARDLVRRCRALAERERGE